jgi:hypothetical protein
VGKTVKDLVVMPQPVKTVGDKLEDTMNTKPVSG